jgi:1-hydroxycarotenoid 3,4-desaturase
MNTAQVVIIGAGIGGLVAALTLASRGVSVVVLERAGAPGGKLREVTIGGVRLDAGPTVFTMRWVFDEIFNAAGAALESYLGLRKLEVLARHAWSADEQLDLFADRRRSADAIGVFAGARESRGYLEFCGRAQRVYNTLRDSFIRAARPSMLSLVQSAGVRGLGDLARISPFATLWQALGEHFRDPRLRQLFGRYATYCGSSPFEAPATLMLVAHVEQEGVWLVEGGMQRVATALASLAELHGVTFRYGAEARTIDIAGGRADAVTLTTGERIEATAVVLNADAAAVAAGNFGTAVSGAVPPMPRADRSLSAVTFAMLGQAEGFAFSRHNVFFSRDYAAEFADLLSHSRLPSDPTVYVCAQGWAGASGQLVSGIPEPLLCLVNAPPNGDTVSYTQAEIDTCKQRLVARLEHCGLVVQEHVKPVVTTPSDLHRLFPATGGALYGPASHGWRASFRRPGARTRIPGLYLAGGSTHPGPGVPMAALSGRMSAAAVLADLDSISRSRRAAMPGGTSTA